MSPLIWLSMLQVVQGQCEDKFPLCTQWKYAGGCRADAEWMNENCPAACGVCDDVCSTCAIGCWYQGVCFFNFNPRSCWQTSGAVDCAPIQCRLDSCNHKCLNFDGCFEYDGNPITNPTYCNIVGGVNCDYQVAAPLECSPGDWFVQGVGSPIQGDMVRMKGYAFQGTINAVWNETTEWKGPIGIPPPNVALVSGQLSVENDCCSPFVGQTGNVVMCKRGQCFFDVKIANAAAAGAIAVVVYMANDQQANIGFSSNNTEIPAVMINLIDAAAITSAGATSLVVSRCPDPMCSDKCSFSRVGNKRCELQCFNAECLFDGGDCASIAPCVTNPCNDDEQCYPTGPTTFGCQPCRTSARIVNGDIITPAFKYPWLVSIASPGGACTAVLIDSKHVLTAHHCVNTDSDEEIPANQFTVYFDAYFKPSLGELNTCMRSVQVSEVYRYPGFDFDLPSPDGTFSTGRNDIAMLVLKEEVLDIPPIDELWKGPKPEFGFEFNFAGYGITGPGEEGSLTQEETVLYMSDSSFCGLQTVNASLLCVRDPSAFSSSCNGDSGGPLFATLPNGKFRLHGLTSWGSRLCTPGVGSGYVDVSFYQTWITEQIQRTECPICPYGTFFETTSDGECGCADCCANSYAALACGLKWPDCAGSEDYECEAPDSVCCDVGGPAANPHSCEHVKEMCVCTFDQWCCENDNWDEQCIDEAQKSCGLVCVPDFYTPQ